MSITLIVHVIWIIQVLIQKLEHLVIIFVLLGYIYIYTDQRHSVIDDATATKRPKSAVSDLSYPFRQIMLDTQTLM